MTRFVVDANVVVQIVISGGDLGPLAGHELIAPPLLRSECLSALSELTYRNEMPEGAGREAARKLAAVPVTLQRPEALDARAWDIVRSLGWARSYDAEYVALADLLEAPLVTLDARLRRGAGHLVSMPLVADLEPAGVDPMTDRSRAHEGTGALYESGQPDLASHTDELLEGFGET